MGISTTFSSLVLTGYQADSLLGVPAHQKVRFMVYSILIGLGLKGLSLRMKCYQHLSAAHKGRDPQSLLSGMYWYVSSSSENDSSTDIQNLVLGKIIITIIIDWKMMLYYRWKVQTVRTNNVFRKNSLKYFTFISIRWHYYSEINVKIVKIVALYTNKPIFKSQVLGFSKVSSWLFFYLKIKIR